MIGEAEQHDCQPPWALHYTGGPATLSTVLIMDGFKSPDGLDMWGFCGHQWVLYGYLPGNTLRYSHCRVCDQTGVKSHLLIVGRTLTGHEARGIRQRYLRPMNHADIGHFCSARRKAAWARRQDELVHRLARRGRS